jgi:TPR repeat protein
MNTGLPLAVLDATQSAALHAWALLSGDAGGVWLRAARGARSQAEALARVLKSSRAGHPGGDYELGLAHWDGLMGEGEGWAQAVACFLRAAEHGHAGAMMMLGEAHRLGLGVQRSLPRALDWYAKGARQGSLRAARILAEAYERGDGVVPDVVKATVWRELAGPGPVPDRPRCCAGGLGGAPAVLAAAPGAAEAEGEDGSLEAPRTGLLSRLPEHLGPLLLFTGGGFLVVIGLLVAAVNLIGFVKWFRTGNLVFAISTFPVFIMPGLLLTLWVLWRGKDVDRRARRSSSRLLKLAEAGDREACYRLGRAFLLGDSEHPKDEDTARRWLLRGAELGHSGSAVQLAQMMRWGAGGPRDSEGALGWLRKAAEQGSAEARRLLQGAGQGPHLPSGAHR